MHLIIGGAYQGKTAYAQRRFSLPPEAIASCTGLEPDVSAPCLSGLENFTLACLRAGEDPVALFQARKEQWQQTVLICRDLSGGVVPMDRELRQWRQETGRLCQYLAQEAETVVRIFCGLEQRLK